MSPRVLRALSAGALALLSGCTLYQVARMEFDSGTGFDTAIGEPETLAYRDEVLRWPWLVRVFEGSGFDWLIAVTTGVRPAPKEVTNPSGLVRERMVSLTDLALGDLGRMADVCHRLLWVAARDDHPLDQIVALQSMTRMLGDMNVDPLAVPFSSPDPVVALEQVEEELARLEAVAPERRGGVPLDDSERRGYLRALAIVSARPSGSASQGRRTVRTLLHAATAERDPVLGDATRRALADTMSNEMAQMLRVKLIAPAPEVREAALVSLHRLSGPLAVPYSLGALATRPTGGDWTYDSSESFRRMWVRLCGQLPREFVFVRYQGGPSPIEFLYDTARADASSGLRLVALDAMARALGRTTVTLERDWADRWWRDYALRAGQGGGQ